MRADDPMPRRQRTLAARTKNRRMAGLNRCEQAKTELTYLTDSEPLRRKIPIQPATPLTRINPLPFWKRVIDLVGGSFGLVTLIPVFLLVALLIKVSSRGPVLFRHKRYGHLGEPFYVWKFRTMHVNTDPQDHRQHVKNLMNGEGSLEKIDKDSRLIPFGKWLRSTAIDELPQFYNVLKGEMSLVGPRPDVLAIEQYEPWQQSRFNVVPGLTGLWQVSGKNKTTFQEMMQLDVSYVERRSIWMDVKIILLTLPAIVFYVVQELFAKRTPHFDGKPR